MTTAFPGGLDAFTRPTSLQFQDSPALDTVVDNLMDAIEALERVIVGPELVNVKAYGAVGDGVANDTTEINDAIAAISSGTVYFPPGTYLVDAATLNMKSNITWLGAGMNASTIKLKDSGNGRMVSSTSTLSNISFEKLGFDFNGYNQTDGAEGDRDSRSGLFLSNITHLRFSGCLLTRCRHGAALRTSACSHILLLGNRWVDNGIGSTLTANTSNGATSIPVADTSAFTAGGGRARIAGEVITYTGKSTSSGAGNLTGCTWSPNAANTYQSGLQVAVGEIGDHNYNGDGDHLRVLGNSYKDSTDTGTAQDGMQYTTVVGNTYENNELGISVASTNTRPSKWNTVVGNVISGKGQTGPGATSVGIKVSDFGNTGGVPTDGTIVGNVCRNCDRGIWMNNGERYVVADNHLSSGVGANNQLLLFGGGGVIDGIHLQGNFFYNTTNRGISFSATGTFSNIHIRDNHFMTVTTPIGGTVPAGTVILGNSGVADNIVTITRGGTLLNPTAAVNLIVWRAPVACVVNAVKGYRVGGTGATINARKNGSSNHLASALSLTSAGSWMDGGAVSNTAYAAGDKLEVMVVSVAGSPSQVAVQVDFVRSG
jgi:hypothetical protein